MSRESNRKSRSLASVDKWRRSRRRVRWCEMLERRDLLSAAGGTGYTASMLKDINTTIADANPGDFIPANFVNVGSDVYFTATDAQGYGLWKSDGTAAATTLVASVPVDAIVLGVAGGVVYFTELQADNSRSIWKTNGASAGIAKVIDLPGTDDSVTGVGASNNAFIFSLTTNTGTALWTSDGTPGGTTSLHDFGGGGFETFFGSPVTRNGTLFFQATESNLQTTVLWKSDGTAAGTQAVAPGGYPNLVDGPVVVGNSVFFTTVDKKLWKSDGTTVTQVQGLPGSSPGDLTAVGNSLFYVALGSDSISHLWRTDAAAVAATQVGADAALALPGDLIAAGSTLFFTSGSALWKVDADGTNLVNLNSNVPATGAQETAVGGTLYFVSGSGLWQSDGSASGTKLLRDFSTDPTSPRAAGNRLFFAADDGVRGDELWTSDGTANGTVMVTQINTSTADSNPHSEVEFSGAMYFLAASGAGTTDLWKTDGVPSGTTLVKVDLGYEAGLFNVNDHLLILGKGLWTSDGTDAGTIQVQASDRFGFAPLAQIGGKLYFTSFSSDGSSNTLWKTDGTAAGTAQVASVQGYVPSLNTLNSKLYFSVRVQDAFGFPTYQLWTSDGTVSGTTLVKDLGKGSGFNQDLELNASGGKLFMTFSSAGFGEPSNAPPLWVSDGTAAGTIELSSTLAASNFSALNGGTVFAAINNNNDDQIWFTDGTVAGTTQIADLGAARFAPTFDGVVGGKVVFDLVPKADGVGTDDLWVTDGTAAGTQLLGKFLPTSAFDYQGYSYFYYAVNLNGKLYFAADDGTHGMQLWMTDGTPAGTAAVTNINATEDAGGLDPQDLAVVNGLLFFSGNDGVHGDEPWVSDGTAAGTAMIQDVKPGGGSSEPNGFTALGNQVFFAAADGAHGDEPWALTPQAIQALLATGGQTLSATVGTAVSGATLATFTDPNGNLAAGQYQATVNWGDGSITTNGAVSGPDAGGVFTVTGTHTYTNQTATPETINVVVTRNGTANATASDTVSVADAPLSGTGTSVATTAQATFSGIVATFSYGNAAATAGDFTATIDWGDGDTTPGSVSGGSGGFQVAGSHVYAKSGAETITVVVSDAGGGQATIASAATVAAAGTPHQQYVMAVYEDVLGRAPDANGLAYWTAKLDAGELLGNVANAIGKSDEYYQNFVIKPDYLNVLGRAADADGLSYWTTKMDSGTTDQQLEADLAASDEVYANAGGTDVKWIDSLYKLLLNRAADADGETYWAGRLAAGASRNDVAQGIAGSAENNAQLINDDYFHYLDRAADADGLTFWLAKFADGETNEDVIAGFTASDEYYKRHTS